MSDRPMTLADLAAREPEALRRLANDPIPRFEEVYRPAIGDTERFIIGKIGPTTLTLRYGSKEELWRLRWAIDRAILAADGIGQTDGGECLGAAVVRLEPRT